MGSKTLNGGNRLSGSWRQGTGQSGASTGALALFIGAITDSFRRAKQRHDLAGLSDYSLRDIGLTRIQVEREIHKPIWRD